MFLFHFFPEAITQCFGTRTNPGQTNPGQTNPGHDKPWTRQTLDTTNPGHDKPWTQYKLGYEQGSAYCYKTFSHSPGFSHSAAP
jgi:hypothetical protein